MLRREEQLVRGCFAALFQVNYVKDMYVQHF
jgi:hypothetical protein